MMSRNARVGLGVVRLKKTAVLQESAAVNARLHNTLREELLLLARSTAVSVAPAASTLMWSVRHGRRSGGWRRLPLRTLRPVLSTSRCSGPEPRTAVRVSFPSTRARRFSEPCTNARYTQSSRLSTLGGQC